MLAESALAVAAFKCSVGIIHLLGQTGTRAWANGAGTEDLGQTHPAGAMLPFLLLLESCGHWSSLFSGVTRRLAGCESHYVFTHLPVLTAGFAPRKGVAPVSWHGGYLSVWLRDCDVALEREGFQIGPLGLPRADGMAQVGQGPPGRAGPTQS